MGVSSLEVHKIIEEKMKYWYKALSDDAMWGVLGSTVDIFDWLSFFSDYVISDSIWSSLVIALLLDIDLPEIVPVNLEWSVELPDIEEFLRGVLIKLSRINILLLIEEIYPELYYGLPSVEISRLITEMKRAIQQPTIFLTPELRKEVERTRLRKAVYGASRYDESYYDPQAVRDFLRSTLLAFTKKRGTWRTARDKVKASADSLGIAEGLVENIFNRLSAITTIKDEALTWDYGWWDRTKWGLEGSEGRLKFITYDLRVVELPYDDMSDYIIYGFWDYANWDFFYWYSEEPRYAHPFRIEHPSITNLQDALWSNFRSRIMTTSMAVANYQTPRERRVWYESGRTHTYGYSMSQRAYVERVTDRVVRTLEPGVDALKLRLYKSATLQLLNALASPHSWGNEMFRSMTDEELRKWWVERWSSAGLKRETLEALYDTVVSTVKTMSRLRSRERISFLRRRLKLVG